MSSPARAGCTDLAASTGLSGAGTPSHSATSPAHFEGAAAIPFVLDNEHAAVPAATPAPFASFSPKVRVPVDPPGIRPFGTTTQQSREDHGLTSSRSCSAENRGSQKRSVRQSRGILPHEPLLLTSPWRRFGCVLGHGGLLHAWPCRSRRPRLVRMSPGRPAVEQQPDLKVRPHRQEFVLPVWDLDSCAQAAPILLLKKVGDEPSSPLRFRCGACR